MIQIHNAESIDASILEQVNKFTQAEFGHIPIVQKYSWSKPAWTISVVEKGSVLAFVSVVERIASFDGDKIKIGGLHNLITPAPYRNKGYASQLMKVAEELVINKLELKGGLLLCAKEMVPFYNKRGWVETRAPLIFDQPDGKVRWEQNVFVFGEALLETAREIDLCGNPW